MARSTFPIRDGSTGDERTMLKDWGVPRSVPWTLVAPHDAQAFETHYQTLDQLAALGGLRVCELCAVLADRPWKAMRLTAAARELAALIHPPEPQKVAS